MAVSLLTPGVGPEKCKVFEQPEVFEHTARAWIINDARSVGEHERLTRWTILPDHADYVRGADAWGLARAGFSAAAHLASRG